MTSQEQTVQQQTFSSLEEMPPEIRRQFEEMLASGKTSASKTVIKIRDRSGREQVYNSWDQVPPEFRAARADMRTGGGPEAVRRGIGSRLLMTGSGPGIGAWLGAVLMGLGLAGWIAWSGVGGIIRQSIVVPLEDEDIYVSGKPAIGVGVAYLGIALLVHVWGCWAVFPVLKPYKKWGQIAGCATTGAGLLLAILLWMM